MAKLDKTPISQDSEFSPELENILNEAPELAPIVQETPKAPQKVEAPAGRTLCTLKPAFVKEYCDNKPFPATISGEIYSFEPPNYEVYIPKEIAEKFDGYDHPIIIKK